MKRLVIFGGEDIISDSAHPVPTQQRFRQAQLPAPPEPSPFLDAQLTPLPCPCSSPGSPGPSLPRTQRAVSGTADLGVPAKCTSVLCVALKTLQNLVSPLPKPSQTHARAHTHTHVRARARAPLTAAPPGFAASSESSPGVVQSSPLGLHTSCVERSGPPAACRRAAPRLRGPCARSAKRLAPGSGFASAAGQNLPHDKWPRSFCSLEI